ncbi:hypothetical protein C8F04DRAFT_1105562 [Mycena alexandri]|uniref:Uncharacterized protein n=1 Tax=Mycena alexandri TaxID=1745969 RepID=A0AAD6SSA0_9AGAR|nr:hypothetical protein C8F04DRAFT_1105562 [Mycena alexandri]
MIITRAILKVFSDETGLPQTLWRLVASDLCGCIASVPPSSALVPLIRGINPDILWGDILRYNFEEVLGIGKVVIWLKDIHPAPEDVIHRWQSYHFVVLLELSYFRLMDQYWRLIGPVSKIQLHQIFSLSAQMLRVLQAKMSRFLPLPLATYRQLVVQSPKVVRIFQARWLLDGYGYQNLVLNSLYRVRLLLGESWDNIMGAVVGLRSIIGELEGTENPLQVRAATTITLLALSLELFPGSAHNLLGELARGYVRLLEFVADSGGHSQFEVHVNDIAWGRLIRCSPYPNPPLLCTLDEFTPVWDHFNSSEWPLRLLPVEFHDVIQWLKAHPYPPVVLIARWEGYLVESWNRWKQTGAPMSTDLESGWQSFKFRQPGAGPLSADFDERTVICSYELALESLVEGPLERSSSESESEPNDDLYD